MTLTQERLARDKANAKEQADSLRGKFAIKLFYSGNAFLQYYADSQGQIRIAAFSNADDAELAARILARNEGACHFEGWEIVTYD